MGDLGWREEGGELEKEEERVGERVQAHTSHQSPFQGPQNPAESPRFLASLEREEAGRKKRNRENRGGKITKGS